MRRTFLLLVALVVALAAAAGAATLRTITLTERDNGRTVAVARKDVVVVELVANPATGYAWKLVARPAGFRIATSYIPPKSKLLGAPGTFRVVCRPVAAAKGTLRLAYVRHTHPATAPAKRFAVRLSAR